MANTETKIDYLDQDPEIRGQKYCCMSFLSPEDVIKRKEVFFFNKFIGAFAKDVGTLFDGILTATNDDPKIKELVDSLKQRHDYVFDGNALGEEFEFYKQTKSEAIEKEYHELNKFQTTIRGIKIRGSYDTLDEAKRRAEAVKKFDKNFNVYVAQVGCWCPWSPNPEDIEDQEYSETQMNTMMKKYKENQADKNEEFRMRRDDILKKVEQMKVQKASDEAESAEAATSVSVTDAIFLADDAVPVLTTSTSTLLP